MRVREVNDAALVATKDYPLFKEIKVRLESVQSSLSSRVAQLLESGDLKEFQTLDETCLAGNAFATRADLYARVEELMAEKPFATGKFVGLKGEPLEKFLKDRVETLKAEAAAYAGKLKSEATKTLEYQFKRVEKAQSDAFFAAYLAAQPGLRRQFA